MMDKKKIVILVKAFEKHKNLISEELSGKIKQSITAVLGDKTVKIESADTIALKKLWRTQKAADGTLMLLNYKGSENIVQVPSSIGGVKVSVLGKEGDIFKGFINSQTIILPAEVAMSEVFRKTQRVKVEIDPKHLLYQQNENLIISRDGTEVIYCNPSDETTLSIPEGIKYFNARVPAQIVNVEFPHSLEFINGYLGGSKVKNIVIPENVKKINLEFFSYTNCLESITTKATISESYGVWSYNGVLKKIEIPESDFYHRILSECDAVFIRTGYNDNLFSVIRKNHTKYEFLCLEFKRLINTWIAWEDKTPYGYPEIHDDLLCGRIEDASAGKIIENYAKFVCKTCQSYVNNHDLFTCDEAYITSVIKNAINGEFINYGGGLEAVTAIIALLEVYGVINECSIDFSHDKYEANNDYSSGARKGFRLNKQSGFVDATLIEYEKWSN